MIVVGLGNPGVRYRDTRHNVGFNVIDLIAERWDRPPFREKFSGEVALVEMPGVSGVEKVYLLKPQTFMNLSGQSVQPAAAFFKLKPEQTLIIHDELDLPLGRLQLKFGGGSGGHNGLKSVTQSFGTSDFLRLRVGIGRPPADFRGKPSDFVLQAFAPTEGSQVSDMVTRAADAVELLVKSGTAQAMNLINRRP